MKVTSTFKRSIARTFYDKEVFLYDVETTTDEHGWTKKSSPVENGSFLGNVNFNNLAKVQEDYGIMDDVEMTITTDHEVGTEQIIGYLGEFYKVIKAIPYDSHYLLIAVTWSSRSSI